MNFKHDFKKFALTPRKKSEKESMRNQVITFSNSSM